MRFRRWSLLLALFPGLALAETAIVPYAALYASLRPALEIGAHDHLQARTRIVSKSRGVPPESIRLEIRARGGARMIRVGRDGDFQFPLDEALRIENPDVASNQPKGSLTLSVTIQLRNPGRARFPYAEIARGLDQVRQIASGDGGDVAVAGVELWFDPAANARLSVEGRVERLLMADRSGRIVLDDSSELREAGVSLACSQTPLQIVPILHQGRR